MKRSKSESDSDTNSEAGDNSTELLNQKDSNREALPSKVIKLDTSDETALGEGSQLSSNKQANERDSASEPNVSAVEIASQKDNNTESPPKKRIKLDTVECSPPSTSKQAIESNLAPKPRGSTLERATESDSNTKSPPKKIIKLDTSKESTVGEDSQPSSSQQTNDSDTGSEAHNSSAELSTQKDSNNESPSNKIKESKLDEDSQPSSSKQLKLNDSDNEAETTEEAWQVEKEMNEYPLTEHPDILTLVINEICLEGLDGITLEALWTRLSAATKIQLPFPIFIQRYVWNIIIQIDDLNFYDLDEAREKLVIYHSPSNDVETDYTDIYPHAPILEECGIMGSSATYKTRKVITDEVRSLSLNEVETIYGNHLVIVGTQRLRLQYLSSVISNPIEMALIPYCMLERIGRSRFKGAITVGKNSLQLISADPKTLFHYSKPLIENFFITKQTYNIKIKMNVSNAHASVLLLQKYHNEKKTEAQIITEKIVELLRSSPMLRMDVRRVKARFKNNIKKLCIMNDFQKIVTSNLVKYRDVHPNASMKDWKIKNKKERFVRVLTLKNPNVNVSGVWNGEETVEESSDEEESGSEIAYNVPILNQLYNYIKSGGLNGRSYKEIAENKNLSYYTLRQATKYLIRKNYILGVKTDNGRLRYHRYFVNCDYSEENSTPITDSEENTSQLEKESLEFISDVLEIDYNALTSNSNKPIVQLEDVSNQKCEPNGDFETAYNILPPNLIESLTERIEFENETYPFDGQQRTSMKKIVIPDHHLHMRVVQSVDNTSFADSNFSSQFNSYKKFCAKFLNATQSIYSHLDYKVKLVLPQEITNEVDSSLRDYSVSSQINSKGEAYGAQKLQQISTLLNKPYMGSSPSLIHSSIDEDNNELKIYVSSKPELFPEGISFLRDGNITPRLLERMTHVAKRVQQQEVIVDVHNISKMIREHESDKEYVGQVDVKSVYRILTRLVIAGEIKVLIVAFKSNNYIRSTTIITKPSFNLNHPLIQTLIEQIRIKFSMFKLSKARAEKQPVKEVKLRFPYRYNIKLKNQYGATGKFVKLKIMHKFLFYLIYGYNGEKVTEVQIDGYDVNAMPTLYRNENNWKMFIPPLPRHFGWPKGWVLISDIVLRIPLSLLIQVHSVPFAVPELSDFLDNPISQHYLIKDLPPNLREILLHRRKYVFDIYEILIRLCYIGCMQFGPQQFREKDHVFVYLNRRASLLDTTTSAPSYHVVEEKEYKQLKFFFKTERDLDSYWYEMNNICANTKMGVRDRVTADYVVQEDADKKAELIATLVPETAKTAPGKDKGEIPGDHRGAAGLDSSLWSNLRRNWGSGKPSKPQAQPTTSENVPKTPTIQEVTPEKENSTKPEMSTQNVVLEKVRNKKEYDNLDKTLMNSLKLSRVEWSEDEDRILCICKIVASFLSPTPFKQLIWGQLYRDVLHKLLITSRTKTSHACLRRLIILFGRCQNQKYLFKVSKTLFNITYVKKYFHHIYTSINTKKNTPPNDLACAFVCLVTYFLKNQNELQSIFNEIAPTYNLKFELDYDNSGKQCAVITNTEHTSSEILSYECIDSTDVKSIIMQPIVNSQKCPETLKDVTVDTIKSLIHSAVGTHKEDPDWLFHLFHLYQYFSNEMLRDALLDVRKIRMISIPKAAKFQNSSVKILPVFSKLLQFSFHYSFMQTPIFPYCLYLDAHKCFLGVSKNLNSIEKTFPIDSTDQEHLVGLSEIQIDLDIDYMLEVPNDLIVLNPRVGDHSELIRELARRYKKMLNSLKTNSNLDKDGGKVKSSSRKPMLTRFLTSWFGNEETPIDDNEAVESREEPSSFFEDEVEVEASKDVPKPSSVKSQCNFSIVTSTNFEDYEKKLETLLHSTESAPVAHVNIRENLENIEEPELSENNSSVLQKSVLSKSKKRPLEKSESNPSIPDKPNSEENLPNDRMQYLLNDDLTVEEIMEEMVKDCPEEERKVPKPENLVRLLLDKPELNDEESTKDVENLHEHFSIKSPSINMRIRAGEDLVEKFRDLYKKYSEIGKKIFEKAQMDLMVANTKPTNEEIQKELYNANATEFDINVAEQIIQFVYGKEVLGSTSKELKEKFTHFDKLNLDKVLQVLLKTNILIRVGINYLIFVHYTYKNDWLIETGHIIINDGTNEMEERPEEKILAKISPWSNIDGSLNTAIIEKWLVTIVGYCITNFMTPLLNIFGTYYYLKPVYVYYLLECLQEMGCIEMMSCRNMEKISLFSSIKYCELVPAVLTDEFEDTCVKVNNHAITKFGAFLNKELHEFDFPEDETLKFKTF